MINELARSPTRSENVYFASNEQALIAVFTVVFCFTNAEHNLIKPKLCIDVTNSLLDDKLPLAGLWLFLVEFILSKERIQNYSFFLISRKMKPIKM